MVVVSVGGGLSETLREKLAISVWPTLSVTVIVYTIVDDIAVGVPDISPSAVWNINPEGRLGVIAKVLAPTPPVAVTGLTGVTD